MPSFTIFQFSHLLEESFVYIAFLPLWITLSNLLSYCMSLSLFGCLIGSSSTNQQYFPTNTALAFRHFQNAELSSSSIIRSLVNTDFPVVFYRAIAALGCWPSSTILCIHIHSIGIGTHSCTVSRTMTTCIYVLSPDPIPVADARHYYPLIINASQAI